METEIAQDSLPEARDADIQQIIAERDAAAEALARAQADLAAERERNLRVAAAARRGLPLDLADRLKGATAEELDADAERLAALLRPASPGVPPAARSTAAYPDPERLTPAQIRARRDELLKRVIGN